MLFCYFPPGATFCYFVAERFYNVFLKFTGLVDNCEFGIGEKETTCQDLQGFWDMVYFQVEDVVEKFAKLGKLEEKNWVEEVEAEMTRPDDAFKAMIDDSSCDSKVFDYTMISLAGACDNYRNHAMEKLFLYDDT